MVTPPVTNSAGPSIASSVSAVSPAALEKSSVVPPQDPAATLTAVAHDPGQFSFQVTGIAGGKYVIEATSDLTHWTSVTTNTAPFIFQDTDIQGVGKRFYRATSVQ